MARLAALLALSLTLLVLENRFFPLALLLPLPGAKLGLANLATLIALELDGLGAAVTVSILRVILAGFFSGTLGAFWFSLGGALLSLVGMAIGRRLPGVSLVGVSMVGAVCHNAGQLLVLRLLMPGAGVAALLPWLILLAVPAGAITGVIARRIAERLSPTKRGGRA